MMKRLAGALMALCILAIMVMVVRDNLARGGNWNCSSPSCDMVADELVIPADSVNFMEESEELISEEEN